jgi:hypothetical protein
MSKRKASDADKADGAAASSGQALMSLDLSNNKTTPKVIATALLALLPPGATKHDAAAKKLLKAYALLTAELDVRSNAMAKANESDGARHPIAFWFQTRCTASEIEMDDDCDDSDNVCDDNAMTVIHMPEECFLKIMAFLNGREIVNASTVNKAWLYVSRMPVLWERLDASNGLSNRDRKMNQTTLLALLGRPQFANLKFLALPYKVKLGKATIASIAKVCPHLETWDVGYSKGSGRGKDSDLMDAVEKFTKLTSIGTNMWDVTSTGISSVVRVMGANLLDLRIDNDCICSHYLHDGVLTVISEHCPNLKHFAYKMHSYCYKAYLDWLSGAGVRDLVRGCRRLEVLELERSLNIERADFESILHMVSQDPGSFALRKIDLIGYSFVIRDNPLSIVDM